MLTGGGLMPIRPGSGLKANWRWQESLMSGAARPLRPENGARGAREEADLAGPAPGTVQGGRGCRQGRRQPGTAASERQAGRFN